MSFAWPLALLGLLVLPLLVAADVLARRRRSRFAVSHPNVELLRLVASRTPSWRRVARVALLLSALAALIVGLARPQVAVSVPTRTGTVMLAMDTSGSMIASDVAPTRLGAATHAAQGFVDGLPPGFRVGVVPFSTTAGLAVAPTDDRAQVRRALGSLQAGGGTAIGDAIELSLAASRPAGAARTSKTAGAGREILLLSDGANTGGVDPLTAAADARRQGVRVDTIAFGTADGTIDLGPLNGGVVSVPPDPQALQAVAAATGGEFFRAADEATLRSVYHRVGMRVGSTTEQHDATFALAGVAAALLAAAAATSIRWRSPLP